LRRICVNNGASDCPFEMTKPIKKKANTYDLK
jgi:hypothetical protein